MGALVPAEDLPAPSRLVPDDDLPEAGPQSPSFGQKALNMIGRGAWALPGLVGLDYETVQSWATGTPKEKLLEQSRQVDAENPIISGVVRGLAAAPGEALTWAVAPEVKLAQGAKFLEKAATYGPRLGALTGASEYGSTASKEPGSRLGGAATAAAAGTVLGGLGAGVLPNPGVLAPAKTAAERLRETAINQGRKVLTGNAAPMATRKPLSEEAIQAAYDVKAIRPFGTVEKAAERLGVAREVAGDEYARLIADLEAKGVTGPNASKLAADLLQEAERSRSTTFTSVDPGPGAMSDIAYELLGLQKGMHGVKRVQPKALTGAAPGGDLPLSVAEDLKRTLQHAAQAEYVKEGPKSLAGASKTKLASRLRQSVEDAVTDQASLAPAEAAAFEPVKRQVGALIEASTAADRGAARAANRQTFGLGSKVLAGGALASGNVPGAVATMLGATALRNRGPATLGWAANTGAKLLSKAKGPAKPTTVTPEVEALLAYLRDAGVRLAPAGADEETPK
jgi:hypothetical protein